MSSVWSFDHSHPGILYRNIHQARFFPSSGLRFENLHSWGSNSSNSIKCSVQYGEFHSFMHAKIWSREFQPDILFGNINLELFVRYNEYFVIVDHRTKVDEFVVC